MTDKLLLALAALAIACGQDRAEPRPAQPAAPVARARTAAPEPLPDAGHDAGRTGERSTGDPLRPIPSGRDEAAICKAIHEEWECVPSDDEDQGCRCAKAREISARPADQGWIRSAALFHIEGMPESGGMVDADYLAIRGAGGGYHLIGMVTNGWIPGAFGINNQGRVDSLTIAAPPHGKGNTVILLTTQHHSDTDMGTNAATEISERTLVVCVAHDEIRGCLSINISSSEEISKMDEAGEQPPAELYGRLGQKKWSLTPSFDDHGRISFRVQSGAKHLPKTHKQLVGTHTVAELVGNRAVELISFE